MIINDITNIAYKKHVRYFLIYLFLWSWAGDILRILQSDWFRELAVFSYLLATVDADGTTRRHWQCNSKTLFRNYFTLLVVTLNMKAHVRLYYVT